MDDQVYKNLGKEKRRMRAKIAWAFTHIERSSSFDYSQQRVQTSSTLSPPIPVHDKTLEQTQVVRIVCKLPHPQGAWLRYCYAAQSTSAEWVDIETIAKTVWKQYLPLLSDVTDSKRNRIKALVFPALQQIKRERNTGRKLYSIPQLIKLTERTAGASQACWSRDWSIHWKSLCGALQAIDDQALLKALTGYDLDRVRIIPNVSEALTA